MERFIGHGTPQWPDTARVPHLYLLPDRTDPDNQEFFDLAQRHRTILTERFADLIVPVQEEWLHATVQMLTDPATPTLNTPTLDALIDALHRELVDHEAFTVWAAPHVGKSGPGLDLAPDASFNRLIAATGTVLDAVLGPARSSYRTGAPHITTGYCHAQGDSGPVASALRASRPSRAPLTLSHVALVMVTQNPIRHTYQWEPLATFSLRGEP